VLAKSTHHGPSASEVMSIWRLINHNYSIIKFYCLDSCTYFKIYYRRPYEHHKLDFAMFLNECLFIVHL